jgi:hypothetical protein
MYYFVCVAQNGMAEHLTRCNLKGYEKCCIYSAVYEAVDDMLWMTCGVAVKWMTCCGVAVTWMGILGVSVR